MFEKLERFYFTTAAADKLGNMEKLEMFCLTMGYRKVQKVWKYQKLYFSAEATKS